MHHILHECVVGCPILSSMYDHVPIYLQLHVSSWTVHLHTFLLSLHSNFSPSRPLQLWFEAAHESSFARDIQHTPCKAPKKPDTTRFNCLFVCPVVVDDRRERQNIARANSEFFRYLLTLSLKKPSTHTHRLDTCLYSLRLNSSSLYPMLL